MISKGTSSRPLGCAGLFFPLRLTMYLLGHAGLSDIDAELEEFSMDPRRSPQRIGNAPLADILRSLSRYSWSAAHGAATSTAITILTRRGAI